MSRFHPSGGIDRDRFNQFWCRCRFDWTLLRLWLRLRLNSNRGSVIRLLIILLLMLVLIMVLVLILIRSSFIHGLMVLDNFLVCACVLVLLLLIVLLLFGEGSLGSASDLVLIRQITTAHL